MFKKIYLVLILAGLAAAQTNFEIATKKYLQDMGDKTVPRLYEKSCREDKNAVGCYIAAQLKSYQAYNLNGYDEQARSWDEVSALYKSACDLGYAKACSAAGDFYDSTPSNDDFVATQDNTEESAEFYEKACENKDGEACLKIAKQHDNASKFADALKYYKLACEAREAEGCYNAADIYESGDGTPKNSAEAAKFYGLACENGLDRGCAKFKKFSK